MAEINPEATYKRHSQGWVDEVFQDLDQLIDRALVVKKNKAVSIAYDGNIVDLWEKLVERQIKIELGSDQPHYTTHGGYYPVGFSYSESNKMMVENPKDLKS